MTTLTLPRRRRLARTLRAAAGASAAPTRARAPAFNRVAYSRRARRRRPARRRSTRGSRRRSTGTRRSPTAATCGRSGLGVAEAMDTAQRGMGLDWPTSLELIRAHARRGERPARRARRVRRRHRPPRPGGGAHARRRDRRLRGSRSRRSRRAGGRIILMAQPRARRASRARPTTTPRSTAACSSQVREPVILHWLGDMFDPALAGYWGDADLDARDRHRASTSIARATPPRSTASRSRCSTSAREIAHAPPAAGGRADVHRRRLQLRRADRRRRAGPLGRAARHLRRDRAGGLGRAGGARDAATARRFDAILAPTVPLSRHIFEAPTRFYKTGVVFMAWLNGHQDALHDGRRPAERALDRPPGRAVPARRRRGAARAIPGSRCAADAHAARHCTGSMAEPATRRASRARPAVASTPRPLRAQWTLRGDRRRAARATASAASRPGATRSPKLGLAEAARAASATPG